MTPTPWWRDAVVYEVYVRSFADSDGDGEGDLQGIRSRLGHLRDLGVDALWLTPFYPSPLADGGYDVADYRDVDPRFGTLGDFDALLADAHAHGLRMIIDIVPNHTSDRHPWFRRALAAPPGSPARDRYLFRSGANGGDDPPNDWPSAFGGSAWSRLPDGEWYLHLYAPEQPDLNWRNHDVRREFEDILRFWLDRGVDGFRIDVAAGLFKDESLGDLGERSRHVLNGPLYNRPEVHGLYREWRRILDEYGGERMAIGEVWTDGQDDLARYLRPDELHQVFQFDLQMAPWSAPAFRAVAVSALGSVAETGAGATWVLSSHDAVRHVTRYEQPENVPGIGHARARAALLLLLGLPGSAYLYQGEELGLPEVTDLPGDARQDPIWKRSGGAQAGRDGCRVPLPWSGKSEPYGFSPEGVDPWLPMPRDWASFTVEAQEGDPGSTLSFYRDALAERRRLLPELPADIEWLDGPDTALFFRRGPLICALNCDENPVRMPPGKPLITSTPLYGDLLPGNAAAWLIASR
ncbi:MULTISPECIES: glycoside hydrolase family 13 protein [Actinomadura]|uniref:Glycoside hydrolase family 13 protein n=1 Tax=Actinomadura yumaensis TaxID=111807 RepID=A0ABW2CWK1_9ACTN|nr:glycoside hydrolase family 13 protein [Actinomadura sp. J1-007]MWK37284.1 alpha-amylase [Actinomadura sp. J1-007]